MNKKKLISIVVPTKNSEKHIRVLLESVKKQLSKNIEVFIVDNHSTDNTIKIARRYSAQIITCSGKPPQVCRQRNIGKDRARGEYVYFIDHDMELPNNFINYFKKIINNKKYDKVDAFYVPEQIVSNSKFLRRIRNFEGDFLNDSPICAARIIKRKYLLKIGFDVNLSDGPGDWDFNNQLKVIGAKFAFIPLKVFHHEEELSFKSYIFKKNSYIKGGERYKKKWKKLNLGIYNNIVKKQYSPYYRLFKVFLENNKWKFLIKRLDDYFLFLFLKIILLIVYFFNKNYNRKYYE